MNKKLVVGTLMVAFYLTGLATKPAIDALRFRALESETVVLDISYKFLRTEWDRELVGYNSDGPLFRSSMVEIEYASGGKAVWGDAERSCHGYPGWTPVYHIGWHWMVKNQDELEKIDGLSILGDPGQGFSIETKEGSLEVKLEEKNS